MSFELVKQYFEEEGMGERVMDLAQSSATVEERRWRLDANRARSRKPCRFL